MASGPVVGQGQIVITANTQPAVAAVQAVGAASQKAATSIGQNFTNAAKALNSSPLISNAETISALFIQMGGGVSRVASIVTSLIRPMAVLGTVAQASGISVGVLVGGLAGVGAGIAGIVAAGMIPRLASSAVELGESAAAAGDRLSQFKILTDAEADAAEDLAMAVQAAKVQQDLLTLRTAASVDAVTELTQAWAGFKATAADAVGLLGRLGDGATEVRHTVQGAYPVVGDLAVKLDELFGPGQGNVGVNWAVNMALKELAERGRDAAVEVDGTRIAMEKLLKQLDSQQGEVHFGTLGTALQGLIDGEREYQRLLDERARKAKQVAEEQARLDAEDSQRARDAILAKLAAEDKAFMAEIQHDQELAAARHEANEALEETKRRFEEIGQAIQAVQIKEQELIRQTEEWGKKTAEIIRDKNLAEAQSYLATADVAIGALQLTTETALVGYAQRLQAGEQLGEREARNANAALAAYEVVSIAQAGISAALAGINSFASLTAVELNPFTAAATAGAISVGSFAAAVYAIHAHKPFEYQPTELGYATTPGNPEDLDTGGERQDNFDTNRDPKGGGPPPSERGTGRGRGSSGGMLTAEVRLLPSRRANKRPRRGR